MTAAKLKFKRAVGRQWLGNGMGYQPASYLIVYQGEICGNIIYSVARGWNVKFAPLHWSRTIDTEHDRLADAKGAVIKAVVAAGSC
jgi:hypothetical protein